jgi:hypothetical protein
LQLILINDQFSIARYNVDDEIFHDFINFKICSFNVIAFSFGTLKQITKVGADFGLPAPVRFSPSFSFLFFIYATFIALLINDFKAPLLIPEPPQSKQIPFA